MVRVDDEDTADSLDLIDLLVTNLVLPPSSAYTTITEQGISGRVTMHFLVRVTCGTNYYGPNCASYCAPQDSDELGHYTCDSNGRRVCRSGYIGEDCRTGIACGDY